MQLSRSLFLALSQSKTLQDTAIGFEPVRSVSRRFVAGETQQEAIAVGRALNQQGLLATLDHLGENVARESEARNATTKIVELIEAIQASGVASGVSVKLTQLGLDLSPALAAENLEQIAARAAQARRFVRIDMESFAYVQCTLDLFKELWSRHKNLGVVIQSYLYRSADDVARLVDLGASVRLVKGAYDEPPEVAYAAKADTDASFVRLIKSLFHERARTRGVFPAIGTHDTKLINWVKDYTFREKISPDCFEFQMLYGVRSGLQRRLAAEGYRVRAYVPYGRQWYPYLMRRLAERPANVLFLMRNLLRT
jgi:proline dehydrogenase